MVLIICYYLVEMQWKNKNSMKSKLTAKLINSLKAKEKAYRVWDTEIPGYFLQVSNSGTKTYRLRYRIDGRVLEFTLGRHGSLTADTARDYAREKAPEAARGIDIQQAKKDARAKAAAAKYQTLKGFIEHRYEPWVLSERKTAKEILRVLQVNFSYLYDRPLNKISPWDIQKWRTEKLKSNLKPASVNRMISCLKSVLSKAVEWEVIEVNPLTKVKPLKLDNGSKVRYLSEHEEKKLRQALDSREQQLRDERQRYNEWNEARGYELLPDLDKFTFADYLKPMVLLAINTGMRRGELFSLEWQNADLKQRIITVEGAGAKSGKTRHIPLNDESFFVLEAWQDQAGGNQLVFPSPVSGNRFDNIKKSWKSLLQLSKVQNFRFHDLRHTFASNLVMAGVDLNTVRELLGHSSIDMTLRYAHLAPEHKAAAVALLNKA